MGGPTHARRTDTIQAAHTRTLNINYLVANVQESMDDHALGRGRLRLAYRIILMLLTCSTNSQSRLQI